RKHLKYINFNSWPGLCCRAVGAVRQEGKAVLSVTTEAAVYSQQAFVRAKDATDPSTGFSSLVDSNADAASTTRDESARQASDQAASPREDSSNAADAGNTTKSKAPPARSETNAASNSDGSAKSTDTTSQQQQPADSAATADPETSTAKASGG